MPAEYLLNANRLGMRLQIGDDPAREIGGVAGDVRHWGLAEAARPEVYVPYLQHPTNDMTLVVRSSLPESAVGQLVRRELTAIDPDQAVFNVRTMERALTLTPARLGCWRPTT